MQQHHKLPWLSSLISNHHARPQTILGQSDGVDQSKVVTPSLSRLLAKVLWTETKVELYAVVDLAGLCGFGGGLSEEFPGGGARESVLGKGGGWVGGGFAEDLGEAC